METYKAILRGDRLEWSGDGPKHLNTEQEVYVTIVRESAVSSKVTSDGKAMAKALSKLAASGSLSQITDPSAWQREQRHERELPDRDS
jgi:hypothetical protein